MGWKGNYVIITTLAAAVTLHMLSNASLSSSGDGTWAGIFGFSDPEGDPAAIQKLVEQRNSLLTEIGQLQHLVSQLEKMDLATDISNEAAQGSLGLRTQSPAIQHPVASQAPKIQHTAPAPPPPPEPRLVGHNAATQPASVYSAHGVISSMAPVPPREVSRPATTAQAIMPTPTSQVDSKGLAIIFEGDPQPPGLRDFPCALRNFKIAQVTTTCVIDCGDSTCSKARETCAGYVECHAMVIKGASREKGLSAQAVAVLKTDSTRSRDDSLERLRGSPWWGTPALSTAPRPRVYIVASYGGCGSKMMAGWLSQLPAPHRTYVFHLHDRTPPNELHQMSKPPAPVIKGRGGSDYRSGRFPGASTFKEDTGVVPPAKIDDYRVVFIYKDPVEALVSRYGFGHCMHIQGDCGAEKGMAEKTWPKLDVYAREQRDRMRLMEHFSNYMEGGFSEGKPRRSYPIVALNYHKLWDNLPAVMAALGLPPELEKTFPKRTETVRNDATGKAEGNNAHTEATRELLRKLYRPMIDSVVANPAVLVV